MSITCVFCGALRMPNEPSGLCCSGGKIDLDLKFLQPLYVELLQKNTVSRHVRAYNQSLAFTSVGTNVDRSVANGVYTYRISGEHYHRIGSLFPQNGQSPTYCQLYLYDNNQQLDHRVRYFDNIIDRETLQAFQEYLSVHNPYVNLFRQYVEDEEALKDCSITFHDLSGTFNAPTTDEVGSIVLDGTESFNREIVLKRTDTTLRRICEFHSYYDPLQYPLLFPCGEQGWTPNLLCSPGSTRRVSARSYYAYHLMIRNENLHSNPVHLGGRLLQQYIVDMYAKVENQRLQFLSMHQADLRADNYRCVQDAIHNGDSIVGRKVLPSSFTGGPRYMAALYQDAMAIVRHTGKPDLFITITCNPNWPELQDLLLPGQAATDRPDIVARIFRSKLLDIIADLKKNKVFGRVESYIYSIEFQKRGLPHCHLLLTLAPGEKIRESFDTIVCAELPSEKDEPLLFDRVIKHMVHCPCDRMHDAPCRRENGSCAKGYPKPWVDASYRDDQGYPHYRRRNNGQIARKHFSRRSVEVDNRNIVPYNSYLLVKYNCHINVEVCSTISAVKYLFKYIHKGPDKACISIADNYDEILKYQSGRYLGPVEAAWRMFGFALSGHSHSVVRLPIHLHEQQFVHFDSNQSLQSVLEHHRDTRLTKFFELCASHPHQCASLTYPDVPKHYTWNQATKEWKRRKQRENKTIGRMYAVSPMEGERYYMRMLLCVVRCPTSPVDVRTVNQVVYGTYKEAAIARGLLMDDAENEKLLEEAASYQMPSALRHTFAGILLFNEVRHPEKLWEHFKFALTEDFILQNPLTTSDAAEGFAAAEVDEVLQMYNTTVTYFLPHVPVIPYASIVRSVEMANALTFLHHLTIDQKSVYDQIVNAVDHANDDDNDHDHLFFLDAPAGTGKTYTFTAITAQLLEQHRNVVSVCSSAIGASLLIDGNTAHSFFKIPLDCGEGSMCSISFRSKVADTIRAAQLIIWDEAPMSHRHNIEAVDRTLRDILQCQRPFGGKVVVFAGDFRQTLPVVPGGNRGEIVDACLRSSFLWDKFKKLSLTINMRTSDIEFNNFLMQVGNADPMTTDESNKIQLGHRVPIVDEKETLIDAVFHGIEDVYFENNVDAAADFLIDRVILAPRNDVVDEINDAIIERLPGDVFEYLSCDTVDDLCSDPTLIQPELLHDLQPNGFPPHRLRLTKYMPVLLLRNLNKKIGLNNGTRLIIVELRSALIKVRIASGRFKNHEHFLFRIPLKAHTRDSIQFIRKQFPIKPCFAMTINKSQGQSIKIVGIHLQEPVFTHGQLYVALSRVTEPTNLCVCLPGTSSTKNIVFTNILPPTGIG